VQFDTVLYLRRVGLAGEPDVYRGSSCSNDEPTCDHADGSHLQAEFFGKGLYYLVIDGNGAGDCGRWSMSLDLWDEYPL
jgi:hypothetical protein